ncbi:unnamed protein product [Trichogramma brassicae]|uniref:Uncharacterized protein n=1 Tax=Trichogramma brassicae TaxID=86971 RepID=A0A6H5IC47_9HYME|nr:unnamed protein product [Trichogramma brassicae]
MAHAGYKSGLCIVQGRPSSSSQRRRRAPAPVAEFASSRSSSGSPARRRGLDEIDVPTPDKLPAGQISSGAPARRRGGDTSLIAPVGRGRRIRLALKVRLQFVAERAPPARAEEGGPELPRRSPSVVAPVAIQAAPPAVSREVVAPVARQSWRLQSSQSGPPSSAQRWRPSSMLLSPRFVSAGRPSRVLPLDSSQSGSSSSSAEAAPELLLPSPRSSLGRPSKRILLSSVADRVAPRCSCSCRRGCHLQSRPSRRLPQLVAEGGARAPVPCSRVVARRSPFKRALGP